MKHRWAADRDYCVACERSAAEIYNRSAVEIYRGDTMECTPLTAVERAARLKRKLEQRDEAQS